MLQSEYSSDEDLTRIAKYVTTLLSGTPLSRREIQTSGVNPEVVQRATRRVIRAFSAHISAHVRSLPPTKRESQVRTYHETNPIEYLREEE